MLLTAVVGATSALAPRSGLTATVQAPLAAVPPIVSVVGPSVITACDTATDVAYDVVASGMDRIC